MHETRSIKTGLLIPLFLMVCLYSLAQSNISIMGVPLSGSIYAFHEKMLNKDFTFVTEVDYMRSYKGLYDGRNSTIVVHYKGNTKKVYRAVVNIHCKEKDYASLLYKEYVDIIKDRYTPYDIRENLNSVMTFYTRPTTIKMSITYSDIDYIYPYKVQIDFTNNSRL